MEAERRASFIRDMGRIRSAALRRRIEQTIECLENLPTITDKSGIKPIRSASGHYYRIRIGSYCLRIAIEGDAAVLVRFLHRSDIYRSFP